MFRIYVRVLLSLWVGLTIVIKVSSSGIWNVELTYGDSGLYSLILIGLVTGGYALTLLFIHRDKYLEIKQGLYDKYLIKLFDERMAPIGRMQLFCDTFNTRCEFLNGGCEKIEEVIRLLKESRDNLFIKAFSGMGKTRWVYEAFAKQNVTMNAYYCSQVENEMFNVSFEKLLTDHADKEITLILDDCPPEVFQNCIVKSRQTKCKIRLIGLSNDMNSRQVANVPTITFEYSELRGVTEAIVNCMLDERLKDKFETKLVSLSECIPHMAILLAEEINKHANDEHYDTITLNSVDFCSRMLHFDGPNKEDEITALESLSLFSPLGYDDIDKWQYEYVMNSNNITAIANNLDRKLLFENVVRKARKQEILEHLSTWINVRPAPLAAWLIEDWFKNCDERRLKAIFDELNAMSDNRGSVLIEAMCHRIENMGENVFASILYSEIVKPGRAFSSEEVINSEMGSRLFLAMFNVNPKAIVEALAVFFESKNIDWIRENVSGRVRRNYVWLLEKACFPQECFHPAAMTLAKLATAENETWGNNSTNQFTQLFHVALPGTNANLEQRLNLLKIISEKGNEYEQLVICCIDKAFDYGDFVRTGGNERIGSKVYKDYEPNVGEITAYWNGVMDFIEGWIGNNIDRTNKIADVFVNHVRQIGWKAGHIDIVKRQIRLITGCRSLVWPEMAKELRFGLNHHARFNDDDLTKMIESMGNGSFVSFLEEIHDNFHANSVSYSEEHFHENESYFKASAERFWSNKEYQNEDTLTYLLDNQKYVEIWFIRELSKLANDEELTALYSASLRCMKNHNMDSSGFLNIICNVNWDKEATSNFVRSLPNEGFDIMYVQIMSDHESEDVPVLHEILCRYSKKENFSVLLRQYLKRSLLYSASQMKVTCDDIMNVLKEKSIPLIGDYILSRRYSQQIIMDAPMFDMTKKCLLEMINQDRGNGGFYEVAFLVADILDNRDDSEFAKNVNLRIIKCNKTIGSNRDYVMIYDKMLPKYENEVLDDILKALTDDDSLFCYNMMYCLGVGLSDDKSNAPLFRCDRNKIKAFCLENAKTSFPRRIATMMPVYSPDDPARFDEFLIWMLDNLNSFKSSDEVLSAIHSNINSFSWAGSPIALYEQQKDCFEKIKEHKNKNVAEWAIRNIKEIDNNINYQFRNESYDQIKYR